MDFEVLEPRLMLSGSGLSVSVMEEIFIEADLQRPAVGIASEVSATAAYPRIQVINSTEQPPNSFSSTVGSEELGYFYIYNTGDATLVINDTSFTGSSNQFYYVLYDPREGGYVPFDTPIPAGEWSAIAIYYIPSYEGSHQVTLKISTNDPYNSSENLYSWGTAVDPAGEVHMASGEWYDAEKDMDDDDSNLCWVGATSNLLAASGWGILGDFEDEYDIFQFFEDNSENEGGLPETACKWWIDGTTDYQTPITDWSAAGFYEELDASDYVYNKYYYSDYNYTYIKNATVMTDIKTYIDNGYSVGLTLDGDITHAINCWGYNIDPDTGDYLGIWVTDSNDGAFAYDDVDMLRYYEIEYGYMSTTSSGVRGSGWCVPSFITSAGYDGTNCMISAVTAVKPVGETTMRIIDSEGDSTDSMLDFGMIHLGDSAYGSYSITNTGINPLLVKDIDLLGEGSEFSLYIRDDDGNEITDDPMAFAIPASDTYTIYVVFNPNTEDGFGRQLNLLTSASDSDIALLLVGSAGNSTPIAVETISNSSILEDSEFSYILPDNIFGDNDGDDLTYSMTQGPEWLSFDPETLTFSGTPENDDVGSSTVIIRASDAYGAYGETSFDIEVQNVNDAPEIFQSVETQYAAEGSFFEFALPAGIIFDIDAGDTLEYYIQNKPAWLAFDEQTLTFSGTPDNEDVGLLEFSLVGQDTSDKTATLPLIIQVQDVNVSPIVNNEINIPESMTLHAYKPSDFVLPTDIFIDEDVINGDNLILSVVSELPEWLTFDSQTAAFIGTPKGDDVGSSFNVTVQAADIAGETAEVEFSINVDIILDTFELSADSRYSYKYIEQDGDAVTVSLKNAAGSVRYIDYGNGTAKLIGIDVDESTDRSSLKISVKKAKNDLADGIVEIETINIEGSFGKISASETTLNGELTVGGSLTKLSLGDLTDSIIAINTSDLASVYDDTTGKWLTSLQATLGTIRDVTLDMNGVPIKKLVAIDWQDTDDVQDSIIAPWIGSIVTKGRKDNRRTLDIDETLYGDFAADLLLDAENGKGMALGSAKIKGEIECTINAGGNYVGAISAGVWSADLTAGYLKSLSTKAVKNTDINGDASGLITITGAGVKDYSIKSVKIAGQADSLDISAESYVGGVAVGQWINSKLTAEYLKSFSTKADKRRDDVNGDASGLITITGTDAKGNALGKLTVKGSADGLTVDAGDGMVGSVTVGQWTAGSLSAGAIKSIKTKADKRRDDVNGDLGIDMTADSTWFNSQEDFRAAKQTLRTAKIANNISGGTWNITGDLGKVTVKGQADDLTLNLIAGDAKSLTFGGLFDSAIDVDGALTKVTVKGWKIPRGEEIPVFTSGSTIAADYVKSANLRNWDTADMTQIQVPQVGDIVGLKYKDTRPESKERWSWKSGKAQPWDEMIEPIAYVG